MARGARPIVDPLRKRRDFLAAAKAERAGVSAFLLQGRDRGDDGGVRVGFTVTKKTGTAVVRNRIRRRLRAAVRELMPAAGRPGFDYVLVAREQALHAPFAHLLSDLDRALHRLHDPARASKGGSKSTSSGASKGGGQKPKGASPYGVVPGESRSAAPRGRPSGRESAGGDAASAQEALGAEPLRGDARDMQPGPGAPPSMAAAPPPPGGAPGGPDPAAGPVTGPAMTDSATPSDPKAPRADGGHPA